MLIKFKRCWLKKKKKKLVVLPDHKISLNSFPRFKEKAITEKNGNENSNGPSIILVCNKLHNTLL